MLARSHRMTEGVFGVLGIELVAADEAPGSAYVLRFLRRDGEFLVYIPLAASFDSQLFTNSLTPCD